MSTCCRRGVGALQQNECSEVGWGKTKRDVECSKASDPGQIRKGLSRTLTGFTNWAESPFMELL